jgi:hypothetical protein
MMRKGFAIAEVLAALCLLAIAAVGISQALSSARVALKKDGDTAIARRALGLSCEAALACRSTDKLLKGGLVEAAPDAFATWSARCEPGPQPSLVRMVVTCETKGRRLEHSLVRPKPEDNR